MASTGANVKTKPGMVYIPTRDLDAAVAWYGDILGIAFDPKVDGGDGAWMATHHFADAPLPRPFLALVQGPGITPAATTVPVAGFNVDDMDVLHEALRQRGGWVGEIDAGGGAKWLRFHDGDGNLLEANWWAWDHL
jgi:catechol 2,3-dioxygenase-like lactoylglutathione lyase family enzyme